MWRENHLSGVDYAVQRRDETLGAPTQTSASQISFDAVIRVGAVLADGRLNLLGEFVSGPLNDRFIYINSGQRSAMAEPIVNRKSARACRKRGLLIRRLVPSIVLGMQV